MPRKNPPSATPPNLPVQIRYDGPTDSLEVTQDGVTIPRGKSDYVSVEAAQLLLGCDFADVTVLAGDLPAAWPDSDGKLDAFAEQHDVVWPEPQNGSQPLTVAEKVAYLEATGYSPDGTRAEVEATEPTNEKE